VKVLEVIGEIAMGVVDKHADDVIASVVRGAAKVGEMWRSGKLDTNEALARLGKLDEAVKRDREQARKELREKWGVDDASG